MSWIFLDVDGVLNTDHVGMDRSLIENLSRIVEATGAKIIVSSNWRHGGLGKGSVFEISMRYNGGEHLMDKVLGRTGIEGSREEEILNFVERNELRNWIAIDDLNLNLPPEHFVRTTDGLTKSKADEAIGKLSSPGDLLSAAFDLLSRVS